MFAITSLWYHIDPNPFKYSTQLVLAIPTLQWMFISPLACLVSLRSVCSHKMLTVDWLSKSIHPRLMRLSILHPSTCWFVTMVFRYIDFSLVHPCKPISSPRTSVHSCRTIVLKIIVCSPFHPQILGHISLDSEWRLPPLCSCVRMIWGSHWGQFSLLTHGAYLRPFLLIPFYVCHIGLEHWTLMM